jgi:hypothetical protein
MTGLDVADLRRNPNLPGFGRNGAVFVNKKMGIRWNLRKLMCLSMMVGTWAR